MMIVMAISTVLCLLHILSFTVEGIITAIVYGAIYGYLFVVLYSLFSLFREEKQRGFAAQYHAPGFNPQYNAPGFNPQYNAPGFAPQYNTPAFTQPQYPDLKV